MRCPKCGRFCKEVKVPRDDGGFSAYVDCSACGRILIEDRIEKPPAAKRLDLVRILPALFLVISIGVSGLLYNELNQRELALSSLQENYLKLYDNYVLLVNTSSTFENYYNELKDTYLVIMKEYSDLNNRHNDLLQIINFNKSIFLESKKALKLPGGRNETLSYDVVYAGYVEIEFNSSTDIFFWIGSSVTNENYYARYPSFPKTAMNGTFIIPVCDKIFVSVYNPNVDIESDVILTIKYIY